MMASRIESEIWSAILSGCPSVTDSDVKRCRPLRLMPRSFVSVVEEKRRAGKRLSLAESRPRVETVIDRAEPRLEHMRVDLRRRQIGMAQHQLDGAQIGAALEQVR